MFVNAGYVTHHGLPVRSFHSNHIINLLKRYNGLRTFRLAKVFICTDKLFYVYAFLFYSNITHQDRLNPYALCSFKSEGKVPSLKWKVALFRKYSL